MSYLKEYVWEVVPESLPKIRRKCPKCNEKTIFINSKKFRINANKNSLDVWLIYQCEKCKSTWNMTILERTNPNSIESDKYDKFARNDDELAEKYGFDLSIHNNNKVELDLKTIKYKIIKTKVKEVSNSDKVDDEIVIKIKSVYPCSMRIDKLLAENLNKSRSEIKQMYEEGDIYGVNMKNVLQEKVKNEEEIHVIEKNETV